jgi:hypothetical protein
MKNNIEFVDFLKGKGFTSSEIQMAVTIKEEGITMAKAIYDFTSQYDNNKIDGFPDSSIKILKKYYGSGLDKMKPDTIFKKVYKLQRCLITNPDDEQIKESIEYYLQS